MGLERRQKLVTGAGIAPSPGMLIEIVLCCLSEAKPARRCQLVPGLIPGLAAEPRRTTIRRNRTADKRKLRWIGNNL
jgi:hypothetical protein